MSSYEMAVFDGFVGTEEEFQEAVQRAEQHLAYVTPIEPGEDYLLTLALSIADWLWVSVLTTVAAGFLFMGAYGIAHAFTRGVH